MSQVAIYTPGWRETKASKVLGLRKQRDGRGLNPRSPDPEFEMLTTRPLMPPLIRKLLIIIIIIIVIIIIIIIILIFQRKF